MVLYLVTVMGIGTAFGLADDEISLARVASLVALVVSALLFSFAWVLLFRKRPATHSLPEGRSLLTAGFHQVYQTTTKIYKEYRALKFFYTSVVFGDAAIQSLAVIAITYVTDQLQFSSQEVGIAAILLLFGAIPGALVGALLNKKINPIRTSASAVVCMMVGISLAATFLTGPGQQSATYFFAFSWGVGTGWKATSDRILSAGCKFHDRESPMRSEVFQKGETNFVLH